jgi:hypothetical protein
LTCRWSCNSKCQKCNNNNSEDGLHDFGDGKKIEKTFGDCYLIFNLFDCEVVRMTKKERTFKEQTMINVLIEKKKII